VIGKYNGGMHDPDVEYLLALEAAAESPEDREALFRLDMAKIWIMYKRSEEPTRKKIHKLVSQLVIELRQRRG
jgi:hypothetical protein